MTGLCLGPLFSITLYIGSVLYNLSEYLNKKPENLTACILDRPRHKDIINRIKKLNPQTEICFIDETSHMLPLEKTEDVASEINNFLA